MTGLVFYGAMTIKSLTCSCQAWIDPATDHLYHRRDGALLQLNCGLAG